MLYDVNLGIRDYFTYTDAMLNNSLFSYFLQKNGMKVYKGESTRDVICLDFDFGSRSYEDEKKRLNKMIKNAANDIERKKLEKVVAKIEGNKEKYAPKKRGEIREQFYEEGVSITYTTKKKDGSIKSSQTIRYRMLYRTSAKAKSGQVIFINEKLYDKAYDWLTMGLGDKMPKNDAKIVEMSAYAPLTTSTIVDTIHIPVEDILILKDQDSFFKTIANVVYAEEYEKKSGKKTVKSKKCLVKQEEREVKNTLWDGMGIIESSYLPQSINGMALLRQHMFKMCGFRGHIQKFFVDWCYENGHDYYTYQVPDMFGNMHYVKDIKIITTDNAIKWRKFIDIMGGTPVKAYDYWMGRIKADGEIWGIVKTDHKSKLGDLQQMSYQMINTLPCNRDDVRNIADNSISYVEKIKTDGAEFEKFLRKNANAVNHYEMLADLYSHNPDFADSTWFRHEKKKIISEYVFRLRTGKITVNGDNLTLCGNPYALLLHSVGEDYREDPSFSDEDGAIQCYTTRFRDDEYLCAFRNPHNAPNNICHLHNVYSDVMERYFPFSENIIAINNICTDVQDRANGCDYDSDFFFVTNEETMVKYAKIAYKNYPTIVNDIHESGITYANTKKAYAEMDNKFAKSQLGIGLSSNLAQLAMTYYWTELNKENPNKELLKELYDNFVILSVLAQLVIDSCKRTFEIDAMEEIDRIQRMDCMCKTAEIELEDGSTTTVRRDFPHFMKYTRNVPTTKNGKELPQGTISNNRKKLNDRINEDLVCPMNWLQEWLDKIQNLVSRGTIPTNDFFIKMKGTANNRQMSKIRGIVEEYDRMIKSYYAKYGGTEEYIEKLIEESDFVVEQLRKVKIGNAVTINRLIEVALGLNAPAKNKKLDYKQGTKYTRKMLNLLYKMDREKFLANFVRKTT